VEIDGPATAQESLDDATGSAEQSADPAAELTAAKARADELYQELQYARAEIENVRKRAERIALERLSGGRKALLGKFLPVIDNLRRALTYEESTGLREGIEQTLKGFETLLAGEHVKPLDVVGKKFDPRTAEAIVTRERDDVDDDTVIEEVQRGYSLDDDILRPALVVVSKQPESVSS
jgi:molecular chaperone GrpE